MPSPSRLDRARGSLFGLAIGDALGMPTQMLSAEDVVVNFGIITGFERASQDHPIAAGMPAGSVTDDTEQAVLLADALLRGAGHVDADAFARALIDWEDSMRARGSLDLLGPSTKAAVSALLAGTPVTETGSQGTTNGAAMRVTPVGIVVDTTDLSALVDRVQEASALTHNTSLALAGASAVAAAVSAGIDGTPLSDALQCGLAAARLGERRGVWAAGGSIPARIELALSLADPGQPEKSLEHLRGVIGTSLASQESVPMAFGILAVFPNDPWRACLAAASQGGDSDTIAAMVGAIGGACHGIECFSDEALSVIRTANPFDLDGLAEQLLALRGGT